MQPLDDAEHQQAQRHNGQFQDQQISSRLHPWWPKTRRRANARRMARKESHAFQSQEKCFFARI
ncbi:MAG TPA: hypothetical protein VII41_00215, partial [Steroidobacteraceae bacterium]